MSEPVAVYAARIVINGEKALEETPFDPPTLADLETVVEESVASFIRKQGGGIDHGLFKVSCEATRTDK